MFNADIHADPVYSHIGATVNWVGMNVRDKFGDSGLNSGRIIRLVGGRTRFTQFCAVF